METWSNKLNFKQLAQTYKTPLYVYNILQLENNFRDYLKFVNEPQNIVYPVKTNPALAILRSIHELGGRVDCASMEEIHLAHLAGFQAHQIVFNSPVATLSQILRLLKRNCTVVIDSKELLAELNKKSGKITGGKIFVRISPSIPFEYLHKQDWQKLTSHSAVTSKFGIPSEQIVELLQASVLPITGLHIHVGTQMDHAESFTGALTFLHELKDQIHTHTPHRIDTIDLGGGLGIPMNQHESFPTITQLACALNQLKRPDITYWVEPGQSLVGNAVGLLTRVMVLKELRGSRKAIVDVGTDQLLTVTLLNWRRQIKTADLSALAMQGHDSVEGPMCFAGDTLLPNTCLNGLQVNDLLFIQHSGAYTYAVSNNFNGRLYNGMAKINRDGSIQRCNRATHEIDLSPVQTHEWHNNFPISSNSIRTIDVAVANQLSSDYLRNLSSADRYAYVSFRQRAENVFDFEIQVQSQVDFISVPFATKIFSDAVIVSIMYAMGKSIKDISVWGDEFKISYTKMVSSNRILRCTVALSSMISIAKMYTVVAAFHFDEGTPSGSTRAKFTN